MLCVACVVTRRMKWDVFVLVFLFLWLSFFSLFLHPFALFWLSLFIRMITQRVTKTSWELGCNWVETHRETETLWHNQRSESQKAQKNRNLYSFCTDYVHSYSAYHLPPTNICSWRENCHCSAQLTHTLSNITWRRKPNQKKIGSFPLYKFM